MYEMYEVTYTYFCLNLEIWIEPGAVVLLSV